MDKDELLKWMLEVIKRVEDVSECHGLMFPCCWSWRKDGHAASCRREEIITEARNALGVMIAPKEATIGVDKKTIRYQEMIDLKPGYYYARTHSGNQRHHIFDMGDMNKTLCGLTRPAKYTRYIADLGVCAKCQKIYDGLIAEATAALQAGAEDTSDE